MTGARPGVTGSGPWPGLDVLEAQTVVVGDLVDVPSEVAGLPFTVTLAERGPWSDRVGRTSSLLAELPTELGPHGWKLADRPSRDLARAHAYLREDVDALAVAAHGWDGPLVVPVLGPLTLAASLYLARGDKVVSDAGAVRELAASLAAGFAEHLATIRRSVPGAQPTVLLHEPLLAQVMAGVLPSFSGYSALRSVPGPVAAERIREVAAGIRSVEGARVVVHGGTAWTSLGAIRAAGVDGFALAVPALDERSWEKVAEAVEGGLAFWPELAPQASSQCAGPDVVGQADTLTRPWRSVGLPMTSLRDVVLVAGPVAGSSPDDARGVLAGLVRAARIVAERAEA
ncbi:hypothetical protein [Cellulomonas fengjieae]|uniref:Methionine synthase n=1 Tax=Cellulomonas fengjieae TaxID=2819978 RepID=A0ABS3SIX4_9CELL|nr:hypothetical protein [Cellulomonas fengjieae]MBO3084891.1 hypothetical protein [Cellulomonas fengjieae]QVI66797.1 hypothetical protein KG102_04195 [Cellulomonas fengjieae]